MYVYSTHKSVLFCCKTFHNNGGLVLTCKKRNWIPANLVFAVKADVREMKFSRRIEVNARFNFIWSEVQTLNKVFSQTLGKAKGTIFLFSPTSFNFTNLSNPYSQISLAGNVIFPVRCYNCSLGVFSNQPSQG